MRRRIFLRSTAMAVLALAACGPAFALEVDQVIWGFDGQVVADRFNLLSVLITNSTSAPFDGQLELTKTLGPQQVDAAIVEGLYLAPHSSRWVQLYPYAKNDWEEWTLSWGPKTADSASLPRPRHGPPACVLLEDTDSLPTTGGAIRRFPDNLFPVQVTATDGLIAAALDHVPRWEEPRQRAFVDWVTRGGKLHLLHDSRGNYPQLTGQLAALDTGRERQRVGAGFVIRHSLKRGDLTTEYVENVLVDDRPASGPERESAQKRTGTGGASQPRPEPDSPLDFAEFASAGWERDDVVLSSLKRMSRPDHSWLLIHLLSWVYIALVGPGCYLLGLRSEGDYRKVFGALSAIVGLFSLTFLFIGRRGYNETTAAYSLAIARPLDGGRYDVTGWTDAFAVSGGDYTFTHDGAGRMYSSCQDEERVRGAIRYGAEAGFTADLPPFSSRAFGYRAVTGGPVISVTIEKIEATQVMRQESITLRDFTVSARPAAVESILQNLVVAKGPGFPTAYRDLCVLYGRYLYMLTEQDGKLVLGPERGSLTAFLKLDKAGWSTAFGAADPWEQSHVSRDELFLSLFAPLVARNLDLRTSKDVLDFQLPDDRVRLFIFAPLPEEFRLKTAQFRRQEGYVLYCLNVFLRDRL
ncbi:MAG: hypothetical protein ACT4QC_19340 [Planctomycetaceae bacterium]